MQAVIKLLRIRFTILNCEAKSSSPVALPKSHIIRLIIVLYNMYCVSVHWKLALHAFYLQLSSVGANSGNIQSHKRCTIMSNRYTGPRLAWTWFQVDNNGTVDYYHIIMNATFLDYINGALRTMMVPNDANIPWFRTITNSYWKHVYKRLSRSK